LPIPRWQLFYSLPCINAVWFATNKYAVNSIQFDFTWANDSFMAHGLIQHEETGWSKIMYFGAKFLPTIIDRQWKRRYRKFCRFHIEKVISFECLSSSRFLIPCFQVFGRALWQQLHSSTTRLMGLFSIQRSKWSGNIIQRYYSPLFIMWDSARLLLRTAGVDWLIWLLSYDFPRWT
jgi:hypothetical protein